MPAPRLRLAALSAALVLLSSPAVRAQTPVTTGQRISGQILANAPILSGAMRGNEYVYHSPGGEHLVITLIAPGFDGMLQWGKVNGDSVKFTHQNNNGLESNYGRDSKLVVAVPDSGEYRLLVLSADPQMLGGGFTLRLEVTDPPRRTPSTGSLRASSSDFPRLEATDPLDEEGGNYDQFTLDAPVGKPVMVTMRSADFDPVLRWGVISGGRLEMLGGDNNSAGGTGAQLFLTPEAGKTFVVRALTDRLGETGKYHIVTTPVRVVGRGGASWLGPPMPRRYAGSHWGGHDLKVGDPGNTTYLIFATSHVMNPDRPWFYRQYNYTANAGERLRITVRSDFFDAFLTVDELVGGDQVTSAGATQKQIAHDDNSGGAVDAQLEITFPRAGKYLINVTSALPGQTGTYWIHAEAL